jgi:hypothetical protein
LQCVIKTNFVNCPLLKPDSKEEFERIKHFLQTNEKCGIKNGDNFFIDLQFWDISGPENEREESKDEESKDDDVDE